MIVDRLIAGTTESERGEAEGELLRQGERAMRVIMARFPGPVSVDRKAIVTMAGSSETQRMRYPHAARRSRAQGCLPFVLERLSDPDPRRAAGQRTSCVNCRTSRLFRICFGVVATPTSHPAAAIHAIVAVGRIAPIDTRAGDSGARPGARSGGASCCDARHGSLARSGARAELVRALVDTTVEWSQSAHDALVQVSCQDFGTDARPWVRWWDHHSTQHRIEWLIDCTDS